MRLKQQTDNWPRLKNENKIETLADLWIMNKGRTSYCFSIQTDMHTKKEKENYNQMTMNDSNDNEQNNRKWNRLGSKQ